MKPETKATIIQNNRTISDLLKENERLAKADGISVPDENYSLEKAEKLQIPSGYIRTNEAFISRYRLWDIVPNQTVKKNIAYALQLSDFHNYILNRINVWGSVETMFLKSAVINLVSIFEALIFECANNICCKPGTCAVVPTCERHFSKAQRNNSFEALKRMKELGIVDYSEAQLTRIKKIIELRNRVHIRLATENEFTCSDFSVALYNETMEILKDLISQLHDNGKALYAKCD